MFFSLVWVPWVVRMNFGTPAWIHRGLLVFHLRASWAAERDFYILQGIRIRFHHQVHLQSTTNPWLRSSLRCLQNWGRRWSRDTQVLSTNHHLQEPVFQMNWGNISVYDHFCVEEENAPLREMMERSTASNVFQKRWLREGIISFFFNHEKKTRFTNGFIWNFIFFHRKEKNKRMNPWWS